MKILHIHPAMRGGGIEAMICGLANEMAKTQDVTVCSIFKPLADDVFWNKLSPSVHKIHLGKSKPGFSIKEIFKVFNLLQKGGYDVVNIHGMFFYYALSVLLLRRKIKFFYTIHSDAVMENSGWDKKFFPLKRFCFKRGWVHPITISEASQKSFEDLYHCKSHLIYNGVSRPKVSDVDIVQQYRKTKSTKLFIHAGRIDTPKNQLVLCKVFKRLIEEGHDVCLLIAGSKQKEQIFVQLEPYFGDRIRYLGERHDIPQLMAQCEAMCLPSIWEGLPVTLLEALSVGCVPICSPVGGIPNVVMDGQNGILSVSSSEEDYYHAMLRYLSLSDSGLDRLRANVKESFSKFDIENTSETYLKTYRAYMK